MVRWISWLILPAKSVHSTSEYGWIFWLIESSMSFSHSTSSTEGRTDTPRSQWHASWTASTRRSRVPPKWCWLLSQSRQARWLRWQGTCRRLILFSAGVGAAYRPRDPWGKTSCSAGPMSMVHLALVGMSLAAPVLMVFWKDPAGLRALMSQLGESQSALDNMDSMSAGLLEAMQHAAQQLRSKRVNDDGIPNWPLNFSIEWDVGYGWFVSPIVHCWVYEMWI